MRLLGRPRFTTEQRQMLHNLINSEAAYLEDDAPVCMFETEEEINELVKTIDANSAKQ